MKKLLNPRFPLVVLTVSALMVLLAGQQSSHAAFPGINGKIAFWSTESSTGTSNGSIFVINPNGTGRTNLLDGGPGVVNHVPVWSPDGSKIASVRGEFAQDYEILVMNADGSNLTIITNNLVIDYDPAWSPDGQKIAFSGERDGNFDIYIMNANGTNETRITTNGAVDMQPVWSPDGTRIAFVRSGSNWNHRLASGNEEIYVVNVNGTGEVQLTNSGYGNMYPDWSPDGSKIVFTSGRPRGPSEFPDHDIYVMNADGTEQTLIVGRVAGDREPVWSPDGQKIAFHSQDGNLYVANSNGTGLTNISGDPYDDSSPDWQTIVPPPPPTPTPIPGLTVWGLVALAGFIVAASWRRRQRAAQFSK